MSQMKCLLEVVTNLHSLADSISDLANGFENPEREPEPLILEDLTILPPLANPDDLLPEIRKILSEKGFAGKNDEVRALLRKYGAGKLSMVDSQTYPDLLREAKEL